MREPRSLYVRTSFTIFISLFIFLAFAAVIVFQNLMQPIARQAAGDMAALMVLSAQTWVELSPEVRPRFELELKNYHHILIKDYHHILTTEGEKKLQPADFSQPFLHFLKQALEERLEQAIELSAEESAEDINGLFIWFDIAISNHIIRVGYPYQHIGLNPPKVIFILLLGAAVLIFLTSSLLVRRLTKPLENLSRATLQMGRGTKIPPLKETGAKELTLLARSFNQMNHRVQQLLDNRNTLLAGISHDLRTPISRIHLALELMENNNNEELLQGIRYDLDEMNHLIGQTLELAISREKALDKLKKVDLNELISLEVQKFKQEYELIQWRPAKSCNALISQTAFQRIFQNLLQNAINYGENSPIKVHLESTSEQIKICISDQGPGIPKESQSKIFQPFFRLEASRNISTGGSGLGLAIVSQLCEIYGWTIQLNSNENSHEKKGCTFCLTIKQDQSYQY